MDDPVDLDTRRGMIALKETEDRRLLTGERARQAELAEDQVAFEDALLFSPPDALQDVITRAIYLLKLQVDMPSTNQRRSRLIAQALAGLAKFLGERPT